MRSIDVEIIRSEVILSIETDFDDPDIQLNFTFEEAWNGLETSITLQTAEGQTLSPEIFSGTYTIPQIAIIDDGYLKFSISAEGMKSGIGYIRIGDPTDSSNVRYTWIKYADSPTSGMSDDPTGKKYIGIANNKTTKIESEVYSDYQWSLTQGVDGESLVVKIVGGFRSIFYQPNGTYPTPSGNTYYAAYIYRNGVYVSDTSDYTFDWSVNGCLSSGGAFNEYNFAATINDTWQSGGTEVTVVISNGARSATDTATVICIKDLAGLDWVSAWDGTVVETANGKILTPRIFAGTVEDDPFHPGKKRVKDGYSMDGDDGFVVWGDATANMRILPSGALAIGRPGKGQLIITPTGELSAIEIIAKLIQGETLILGGLDNGDGSLVLKDIDGNLIGTFDKNGVDIKKGNVSGVNLIAGEENGVRVKIGNSGRIEVEIGPPENTVNLGSIIGGVYESDGAVFFSVSSEGLLVLSGNPGVYINGRQPENKVVVQGDIDDLLSGSSGLTYVSSIDVYPADYHPTYGFPMSWYVPSFSYTFNGVSRTVSGDTRYASYYTVGDYVYGYVDSSGDFYVTYSSSMPSTYLWRISIAKYLDSNYVTDMINTPVY